MSKQGLPDIEKNFSDWYNEVIYRAELADQSPVRGCMVIRPYGVEIWEGVKSILDDRIKKTGHQNVILPLLIPESFLAKESRHVEGFSPELAVVTHAGGKKLEESLIIRPTSETMFHYMFAKWIKSWRDLPMKLNQWANIVRWEMRTRPFLRTTEIFWQEGHTAHETVEEAEQESTMMLKEYVNLAQNYLAIPVIAGLKSESEKFPGADKTYTFESLMPDGKALQMGTSHIISQNFAKSFEILYQDREGNITYPYLTSWGATTRLIGALVMMHGDQKGLIMPPRIAPIQVIIIPILKSDQDNQSIIELSDKLKEILKKVVSVEVDYDDTKTPGAKFYKWEMKGVPIRIEIGPKDVYNNQVVVVDRLGMQKDSIPFDKIEGYIVNLLSEIQMQLFARASKRLKENWHIVNRLPEFAEKLSKLGGFYQVGWCRNPSCESELKRYQATVRCLLEDTKAKECFFCDKKSISDVLIAKSY